MFCLSVNVPHACSARGGQKTASDPLKLEPQLVVSHHVDDRTQRRTSGRAAAVLTTEPPLLAPKSLGFSGNAYLVSNQPLAILTAYKDKPSWGGGRGLLPWLQNAWGIWGAVDMSAVVKLWCLSPAEELTIQLLLMRGSPKHGLQVRTSHSLSQDG